MIENLMKSVAKVLSFAGMLLMLSAQGYGKNCPTTTLNKKFGTFTSPGYPDDLYSNGLRCRYVFKARPRHLVKITFSVFELEPPRNAKLTDFVKIIDGQSNPVVYYHGAMNAPLTFVSKTNRVIMRFLTNKRKRKVGFSGYYEQIREPVKCDPPNIENGLEDCNELECNISCIANYQLEGSMEPQCNTNDGTWTDLPTCVLIPAVVDICLGDINDADCPYTAEDLSDYFSEAPVNATEEVLTLTAELGDGLVGFREIRSAFEYEESITLPPPPQAFRPPFMVAAAPIPTAATTSSVRVVACPSYICLYNENGKFKYSCTVIAQALKRKNNLSDENTRTAMIQCFQCQNSGCSPIQLFS